MIYFTVTDVAGMLAPVVLLRGWPREQWPRRITRLAHEPGDVSPGTEEFQTSEFPSRGRGRLIDYGPSSAIESRAALAEARVKSRRRIQWRRMDELAAVLTAVPLFSDLSSDEIAGLCSVARRRRFAAGQPIFFAGDPGDALFVIESGSVKIGLSTEDGKEVVLTVLGPADFFGDLALLDGEPRSADAVATEETRLLVIGRRDFERFIGTHPTAALRLLAVLSRRLRRNAAQIQDAAFADVPRRLARALHRLAGVEPSSFRETVSFELRLSQAELAAMIGATRESVNKAIRHWEERGLLTRTGRRIAIESRLDVDQS